MKVRRYLHHAGAAVVSFNDLAIDLRPAEGSHRADAVKTVDQVLLVGLHSHLDRLLEPDQLDRVRKLLHLIFLRLTSALRDHNFIDGQALDISCVIHDDLLVWFSLVSWSTREVSSANP